tara:strand:- start:317 stop:1330 length:1014 start_codon:yes stop_codon:yes gene_type:complete
MSDAQTINPADAGESTNEHIRADRACVGCGFNLYGQTVSKDPHYGLAIARCPECGQVAALQSYPTMSRWVNRFRALLASFWVIGLLGVFFISTLITLQIVNGALQLGSEDLAEELGIYHETWSLVLAQQQADAAQSDGSAPPVSGTINLPTTTVTTGPAGTTTTTINRAPMGMNYTGMYSWGMLSEDWIEQELDSTMMNIGGIWKNLNKEFLAILLPASFFALLLGVFWSITMLGARRRTIIWLVIVAQIIAVVILLAMILIPGSFPRAIDIAKGQALPVIMPIIMGAQLIFALLGVYLGRKIARFVICMSLPPRYRTSLSIFWTRDGLELPKPTLK